jgi:exodeoxyribonuclease VII large subunit
MSRPAQPDWPPVISVSELNQSVAALLERSIPLCWIRGEISNFTKAASGHWYFTLKDDKAQVRSVMFRGRAQYAGFMPREGDRVEVRASVGLYAPRGDYQINVEAMRRAGVGNLFEAFLQLKQKLTNEGCFDPQRKQAVPGFVRQIGLITSPGAAALRDIVTTLRRRTPHISLILYPTLVQGADAVPQIVKALQTAGQRAECQVLLLCRGGGSIEDLWAFNEEAVARAILACPIPLIAGIGHETDFTIADFCADLRAATPTAAAELAATPTAEWQATLQNLARHSARALRRQLDQASLRLDYLSRRLPTPNHLIARERMRLSTLAARLETARSVPLTRARHLLTQWQMRLAAQRPDLARHASEVARLQQQLRHRFALQQQQRRQALHSLAAQLELLNPQRTLERGYAIVQDEVGQVVRDASTLYPGQNLQIRLARGKVGAELAKVQAEPRAEPDQQADK